MKPLHFFTAIAVFLASITGTAIAQQADWAHPFCQYRLAIDVDVRQTGWNVIPLDEADISQAISQLEEYSFDPMFLAYNHVWIGQVDPMGRGYAPLPEAGFYLVTRPQELVKQDPTLPIPTEKDAYYQVRFTSEGGKFPPTVGYEQVFPVGEPPRTQAYMSSYVPRLLPRTRTNHECLLRSDGTDMKLAVGPTTIAENISVRRSRISLLAKFKKTGPRKLVLYYQPLGAHYLKIPKLRRAEIPSQSVAVTGKGLAEKRLGNTRYGLGGTDSFQAWFADTTVKLTPRTPVPSEGRKAIHISTAANESQSFQLVLSPRTDFAFEGVRVSSLSHGDHRLAARNLEIRQVEYVKVARKARINQVSFFDLIGDPLVPVSPRQVKADSGNLAFWVTLRTPPGTPAGDYVGTLSILGKGNASAQLSLVVTVHDFELPEFSTFRSNMGGQYLAKKGGDPTVNPIMAYHGIQSREDLKKLAFKYYEAMAREKFYPKNVALFTEIGLKWKPPPQGYNVAAPGNYFELVEWDFTEFNQLMKHFIDKLKVNSVCLTHTNPSVSHIFKHLPGKPASSWNPDPGHVTMGWQTFREMTQVTYQKQAGDPWFDTSVVVTRDQWDRLVLDYYRAMVRNLKKHGWLDKFYYFVDETSGTDKILHLIRLLKSDPETSAIRFAHCLQGFESLYHQENGKYVFSELLTHVPQVDENYYRWEDYFWDDYQVPRDRDRLWSYAAYSSRLGINVPGMTNREIGLELFNLGGSGYVIWDTLMWHHTYGEAGDVRNPWVEPYTRLANGGLCYFYPPRRTGLSKTPDFTITPSLRVMTFRESVDDYEYARILEDLVTRGAAQGVDVTAARSVLADIRRMFPSSVEWTLNDAWYLDLRERMARSIGELKLRLGPR